MSLKLNWCSHEAAKYSVEHWHYSRCLPVGKLVKIGVWEDSEFIGCVIFSRGSTPNISKPYGLKMTEVCELTRVALNRHKTPVTKIIKIALKFLKNSNPGMRLVVSYADQNQDHVGTIYQAGNWVYTGVSDSSTQYYYQGKWRHQRSMGSLFTSLKGLNIPKRKILNKYKYIMPLDKEIRNQVIHLAKTYPKCVGSSAVEHQTIQSVGGGSIPTPTHHSILSEDAGL